MALPLPRGNVTAAVPLYSGGSGILRIVNCHPRGGVVAAHDGLLSRRQKRRTVGSEAVRSRYRENQLLVDTQRGRRRPYFFDAEGMEHASIRKVGRRFPACENHVDAAPIAHHSAYCDSRIVNIGGSNPVKVITCLGHECAHSSYQCREHFGAYEMK